MIYTTPSRAWSYSIPKSSICSHRQKDQSQRENVTLRFCCLHVTPQGVWTITHILAQPVIPPVSSLHIVQTAPLEPATIGHSSFRLDTIITSEEEPEKGNGDAVIIDSDSR